VSEFVLESGERSLRLKSWRWIRELLGAETSSVRIMVLNVTVLMWDVSVGGHTIIDVEPETMEFKSLVLADELPMRLTAIISVVFAIVNVDKDELPFQVLLLNQLLKNYQYHRILSISMLVWKTKCQEL